MVFGLDANLKNQLEEITEERDFFQAKYQEQMEELTALRKALEASQREIARLRTTIIAVGSPTSAGEEKKEEEEEDVGNRIVQIQSVTSGITEASEVEEELDLDENAAIRESASKLLEWVDHRVSVKQIQ